MQRKVKEELQKTGQNLAQQVCDFATIFLTNPLNWEEVEVLVEAFKDELNRLSGNKLKGA